MLFTTIMAQIFSRTTTLFSSRHNANMNGRIYLRTIVTISFFSLSLICSNKAYLHLSVAFIQMLKATTPSSS